MKQGLLEGRVALVTGAGGGIGRKICAELANEGASLAAADLDEQAAKTTSDGLRGSGRAVPVRMDVSSEDSVKEAIAKTRRELGTIDILVNNAGVLTLSPLLDLPEGDWDLIMDVNAKGVFLCTKHFANEMVRLKRPGVIVNVSSIAAKVPIAYQVHYCASKAAVIAVTKVSALELAPYGIRVNAVCPGAVDTKMFADVLDYSAKKDNVPAGKVKDAILSRVGIRRLIQPSEIGRLVAFLCSDQSSVISGQAINIDGGNPSVNY